MARPSDSSARLQTPNAGLRAGRKQHHGPGCVQEKGKNAVHLLLGIFSRKLSLRFLLMMAVEKCVQVCCKLSRWLVRRALHCTEPAGCRRDWNTCSRSTRSAHTQTHTFTHTTLDNHCRVHSPGKLQLASCRREREGGGGGVGEERWVERWGEEKEGGEGGGGVSNWPRANSVCVVLEPSAPTVDQFG